MSVVGKDRGWPVGADKREEKEQANLTQPEAPFIGGVISLCRENVTRMLTTGAYNSPLT